MQRKQVLIVEDDPAIRQGLADALRFDGYEPLEAANGRRGLELALEGSYDVLLLDLVLPEVDGFEILRQTRQARPLLPILILTARGAEDERVRGLRLGADDYVVKPFSIKELLARIEAVLRRTPERPNPVREVPLPGGSADPDERQVRFDNGESRQLSEREAHLLAYLASNAGRVLSRQEILQHVWHVNPNIPTRTVDMHVARLREKLRRDELAPDLIVTVRGRGYQFRADVAV